MHNGKEYDKVFDIEVDDGVTLQCGYNFGDNPYSVAQDFIWDNDLPQVIFFCVCMCVCVCV